MTPQERLDAYIVHIKEQQIVNDSMTCSEYVRIMGDLIYQWLIDHDIEVVCNLPRKL